MVNAFVDVPYGCSMGVLERYPNYRRETSELTRLQPLLESLHSTKDNLAK